MPHAWMPGARRIRAGTDGGPLKGGAPRAVWLTLGTDPCTISIQSAATRLAAERRPPHLVWDPVSGEIVQLVSILRAGAALGAAERLTPAPGRAVNSPAAILGMESADVNTEGRVCAQIGVLGQPTRPFTGGPMVGLAAIVDWLDSWHVPRCWPAGQPSSHRSAEGGRSRALWAFGGHFGASQVPGCENRGPGGIDISLITGTHVRHVHARESRRPAAPAAPVPIPA